MIRLNHFAVWLFGVGVSSVWSPLLWKSYPVIYYLYVYEYVTVLASYAYVWMWALNIAEKNIFFPRVFLLIQLPYNFNVISLLCFTNKIFKGMGYYSCSSNTTVIKSMLQETSRMMSFRYFLVFHCKATCLLFKRISP